MLSLKNFLNPYSSKIFICYRHEDTRAETRTLFGDLKEHFRRSQIFKDTEAVQLGENFEEAIRNAVGSCDVFILVIGRRWHGEADTGSRLNDPDDYVRLEIATAFNRGVQVIPVLVQGATMPSIKSLPDELALLSKLLGIEISDSRWDYDVGRLIKRLEGILPKPPLLANKLLVPAICLLGLVAFGILALTWNREHREQPTSPPNSNNSNASVYNGNAPANVIFQDNGNVYTNNLNFTPAPATKDPTVSSRGT